MPTISVIKAPSPVQITLDTETAKSLGSLLYLPPWDGEEFSWAEALFNELQGVLELDDEKIDEHRYELNGEIELTDKG